MRTDHLPFPMPSRPHALMQEWRDLTFLHWRVEPAALEAHLPEGLALDLHDGEAYLGVVPFMMRNIRPRWAVPVPGVSDFPEFNLRTYVVHGGRPGVFFLTLEAMSRITCAYAPRAYGCPTATPVGRYRGRRWSTCRPDGSHAFSGTSVPRPFPQCGPGTLEHFLFERYLLHTEHENELCIGFTQHDPWALTGASATVAVNALTGPSTGINDLLVPDLVHRSPEWRCGTGPRGRATLKRTPRRRTPMPSRQFHWYPDALVVKLPPETPLADLETGTLFSLTRTPTGVLVVPEAAVPVSRR